MMCTRGPCRAPPSCRCVQWVRGGPREGGGGRGRAPEPRAQKMQQAGSMYTQRDAQHGVHDAPRKIATAAAAAAACGRARGARAAPAACKGDPGAAHRGLARASLTRRCRENPSGRGWNTKNVTFFTAGCCLHLLEDGGRGRPSTPCTLPSQSTFTQSHAWLAYTGRTTRTIGAWRAAGRRRRTAGTARRRARPWKRALKVDEVFSPSPCFLGECRQVECWQPSHVHLGWPPQ